MGYYMEVPRHKGKAEQLERLHKGERIAFALLWEDIPDNKFLIIVIDNGAFEAAGIAVSSQERDALILFDGRRREYVLVPKEEVYTQHPSLRNYGK